MKKIHQYTLQNFLKTFFVTFVISIFVLVMQFMFRYIDDLVGKGVSIGILAEFFAYAALSLVPLSLPLSILLGSLMTFGNLGERLELLAMKASGISLFKIMKPLIILIFFISIGSYFFANNILPKTQVKMWALLFSIRETNPELDIPEGAFYNGIEGRNLFVGKKTKDYLLDVTIYDYTNGFKNTSIIIADTATISLSADKKHIILNLFSGQTFETFKQDQEKSTYKKESRTYSREKFARKDIIIDQDANFKELNDNFLKQQYVSKNTQDLQLTIDSINQDIDSINYRNRYVILTERHLNNTKSTEQSLKPINKIKPNLSYDTEDIYLTATKENKIRIIQAAIQRIKTIKSDQLYMKNTIDWKNAEVRRNDIEWHTKHTLAFACFIFLFIGAPLGAIIRKGGMGMPVVLSTVLFIIYYIIDNTGYKMAREGIWTAFEGMWLSASILLPLGIFLTYMAATDSTIMNGESYINTFKKFFSKKSIIFVPLKKLKQKFKHKK